MGLVPFMISLILCNGMQTAMGSSKEQGVSTNNCKNQGSTTIKAKDQQITVNTMDPQQL